MCFVTDAHAEEAISSEQTERPALVRLDFTLYCNVKSQILVHTISN